MLKSIVLRNFQSHRETEIKLSSGINCFVGDSCKGKTAIIRGVQLVRTNRPLGFKYHNKHAKKNDPTGVILTTEKDRIVFSKTKTVASYQLNNEVFSPVGTTVPDKIIAALNMSDINVQNQLDAPYLITESGGSIAKTINRITKLDICDDCITDFTSEINQANRKIEQLEGEIENGQDSLKRYKNLDTIEDYIEEIENIDREINKAATTMQTIMNCSFKLVDIDKVLDKRIEEVDTVSSYLDKIKKLDADIKKLENDMDLLEEYLSVEDDLVKLEVEFEDSKKKYLSVLKAEGRCPFCMSIIDIKKIKDKI